MMSTYHSTGLEMWNWPFSFSPGLHHHHDQKTPPFVSPVIMNPTCSV